MAQYLYWTEDRVGLWKLPDEEIFTPHEVISYMQEARGDVLFLQMFWMAAVIFVLVAIQFYINIYKIEKLEEYINRLETDQYTIKEIKDV